MIAFPFCLQGRGKDYKTGYGLENNNKSVCSVGKSKYQLMQPSGGESEPGSGKSIHSPRRAALHILRVCEVRDRAPNVLNTGCPFQHYPHFHSQHNDPFYCSLHLVPLPRPCCLRSLPPLSPHLSPNHPSAPGYDLHSNLWEGFLPAPHPRGRGRSLLCMPQFPNL